METEWKNELGVIPFEHKGYKCLVVPREILGSKYNCGYVALPKTSKFYRKRYTTIPITCHGGLTYSGNDLVEFPKYGGGIWWIGFDCNHAMDMFNPKNVNFCILECKDIVEQIIALEKEELDEYQKN